MRVRVYMSGNEMMDILNEEKLMCMVVGEWGGGVKMMMIFFRNIFFKKILILVR